MQSRRTFLQKLGLVTAGGTLLPMPGRGHSVEEIAEIIDAYRNVSAQNLATDEDFWHYIKQSYTVSATILNLNNGGVSPSPKVVQDAVERYNKYSNEAPTYYMWRILDKGREPLRNKLAQIAGCSPEEIAINRNSSEALETVIFGLELKKGDEVVLSKQDYPNMINAWKQRERRDGIKLKWLDFRFPMEDADAITRKFTEAFTRKTKLVHITHMVNWNGQLMPVAQIARAAHARDIEVLVDAAHTFAHIDYKIPDLECDYYGTSLHKWLCAPFGSGMLYVKKEKIGGLYPLLAAPDSASDDIRKFEHLGTRSFAIEQAIAQAADFHLMIGAERKEARLHYLKNYWAREACKLPGVTLGTSLKPEFSCAICLLQVEGKTHKEIASYLFSKHQIHTVAIAWRGIVGARITPNVYTLRSDLDRLLEALKEMVG